MWPLESGCKLKKLSNPSLFFLYDFVALYISYLIWEGAHVIGLLNKKLRFIILLEPNLKKKKKKIVGEKLWKRKISLCFVSLHSWSYSFLSLFSLYMRKWPIIWFTNSAYSCTLYKLVDFILMRFNKGSILNRYIYFLFWVLIYRK